MQIGTAPQAGGFTLADLDGLMQAEYGRQLRFCIACRAEHVGRDARIRFGLVFNLLSHNPVQRDRFNLLQFERHAFGPVGQGAHDCLHMGQHMLTACLPVTRRQDGAWVAVSIQEVG